MNQKNPHQNEEHHADKQQKCTVLQRLFNGGDDLNLILRFTRRIFLTEDRRNRAGYDNEQPENHADPFHRLNVGCTEGLVET